MVNDLQLRVADFVERYGLRVAAGPANRPHTTPINRNCEDAEVGSAVVKHCRALAGMIRAGIIEPEADWPELSNEGTNT